MLEDFLDTGFALAAPVSGLQHRVALPPGGDPSPRVRTSTQARMVLARARLVQKDPTAALVVLRTAAGQLEKLRAGRQVAQLFRELGELFELAGDSTGATNAYRRALEAAGLRPTSAHVANYDFGHVHP
jgi:thioredoxin-like negative regulator of GroEL